MKSDSVPAIRDVELLDRFCAVEGDPAVKVRHRNGYRVHVPKQGFHEPRLPHRRPLAPRRYKVGGKPSGARRTQWEPPWGIEPRTYALREACSPTSSTLPAPMPREGAVTAPNAPGFSGDLFHDSFHAYVGAWPLEARPSDP
jgi:hypothetical protein